ncbi:MAG: hypothetical protein JWP97_3818 [Labilithrix sp.]|nr:hypothetical protein [Labilithrix sp.]
MADAAIAEGGADVDAAKVRTKKGGTDVTFAAISDTHFGFGGIPAAHDVLVPRINGIAGHAYPKELGGTVGPLRGLLVTGDLTEWGWPEQWDAFAATYGLDGGPDGKVKVPVFEVEGNHDKVSAHLVEEKIAARHGARFYSFDWDDLHMVALGEAPNEEGLAFLERDLGGIARDVPVILYFHLALAGPWSEGNWFAEGDLKSRLAKLATAWNVIAIFHGHHHATDHYVWNGIDVFKPGAVKHDAHTFAVVHVTDAEMTVAEYDWRSDGWESVFTIPLRGRKKR